MTTQFHLPQSILFLAQAPPEGGIVPTLISLLPFFFLFIFFYILFLRPQKKEQQRLEDFRKNLQAGDEVITNSGIIGKISSIDDKVVHLEIARSTKIRILKQEIVANSSVLKEITSNQSEKSSS